MPNISPPGRSSLLKLAQKSSFQGAGAHEFMLVQSRANGAYTLLRPCRIHNRYAVYRSLKKYADDKKREIDMIWFDVILLILMGFFAFIVFALEFLHVLNRHRERPPRLAELIASIKPMTGGPYLHLERYRRGLGPFFQ